ncbi:CatB-related O-acetyltransferase [Parasphingorhabdus sp. DH2-15]|uniref:CatB-related O-acetyltransferase n=1 Tax=Parasphingorhabdus sp. DH2-15 TaxID=3444112 RepID=UPI003F683DDD
MMLDILRRIKRKISPARSVRLLQLAYPKEDIGTHSYGGVNIVRFGDDTSFTIGKYCSFAANVILILGGGHRTDWVTTYPFSDIDLDFAHIKGHPASKGDIIIGNDVWAGRDAMILSGVKIGNGAVIAARAVVTKDVPPYAVVAGQPARIIKHRFAEDVIDRLNALQWWDWPDERVKNAVPMMLQDDIVAFLDAAEAGKL